MKFKSKTLALTTMVMLGGLFLAGCKEEEQDRILMFQKGTYLGQDDNSMGGTTAEELRARAKNQGAL